MSRSIDCTRNAARPSRVVPGGCERRALRWVCAWLMCTAAPAPAAEVAITLLHTNDLHQELDPLPHIAGWVAEYRRAHPATLFFNAGDFLDRGSPLVALTTGEIMCAALVRMGYDAVILGNHDWIYGDARVLALIDKYRIPVLGTNLATTTPPLPPHLTRTLVKEIGGIRLGLFGVTLDTYGKDPRSRPHLHVTDCREATAEAIAQLQSARVDLIVALTHLGFEKMKFETESTHPSDRDLAKQFPAIDVIIGGHTHTHRCARLIPARSTRRQAPSWCRPALSAVMWDA